MFKKIGEHFDKKHFGNKVMLYQNEELYMLIVQDRGEFSYYLLDKQIERLYPINTLIKKEKNIFKYNKSNEIDIDLSRFNYKHYGSSLCSEMFKKVVIDIINNN